MRQKKVLRDHFKFNINCETHGVEGHFMGCPHIAEEVDNNRIGHIYEVGWFLFCEDCLHKYRLEHFVGKSIYTIYPSYKWERFQKNQDFEWTFHCNQCIAVAKVEQARRNGEDDPFPVYEKTLTLNHIEIIEELRIQVMENCRSTINDPHGFAVSAKPGAYTYPMTIWIGWIPADEDEDKQIVSFIDAFLQGQELNQAKIEFLHKEVLLNC